MKSNGPPADDDLDSDFPLADGTAETSADVVCPYCAEGLTIAVDPGGGSVQQYVEDCEVCCNPWQVTLRFVEGIPMVELTALDE
jgi:hypothetical protein